MNQTTGESANSPSGAKRAVRKISLTPTRFTLAEPSLRTKLICNSVLFPIGRNLGPYCPPHKTAEGVLDWWRGRVAELYNNRIGRFAHHAHATLASNCFPSMVPTTRVQNRVYCTGSFCPWCWGRDAGWLADKLGLAEEDGSGSLMGAKVVLAEADETCVSFATPDVLRARLELLARCARGFTLVHRECLDGAFWWVYPEPTADGVELRLRWIGVRDESLGDLFLFPRGWKVSEGDAGDRSVVEEAFKSVARYPVGLVNASIPLLGDLIQAKEEVRLRESVGFFREKMRWTKR